MRMCFAALYACRFGAAAVHSMVSTEPHLLSSSPKRLLANKAMLQQQLGLDDGEMRRVILKARR